MKATKFFSSLDELQKATYDAQNLPSASTMAAFALTELVKLGFVVEAAQDAKQAKVPQSVKDWAQEANKWAVGMKQKYTKPDQEVDSKHLDKLKEFVKKGNKLLPDKHKACSYLSKVKTS